MEDAQQESIKDLTSLIGSVFEVEGLQGQLRIIGVEPDGITVLTEPVEA